MVPHDESVPQTVREGDSVRSASLLREAIGVGEPGPGRLARRCFYCDARLAEPVRGHVDHFVPWSRYPDDTLDNFVVADQRCNGFKSSSLAAAEHLTRWTRRFADGSSESAQLSDLARRTTWERLPDRSRNVARAFYLRLPSDARLWRLGKEFVAPDFKAIE